MDGVSSAATGRDTRRLEDKRALVTGGASGIGAAVVARFRAEGALVFAADLAGGDVRMDVRNARDVGAGVETTIDNLGGLDVLVCNAGLPVLGSVGDLQDDQWEAGIDTNLKGVFLTARAAWPHLVDSRGVVLCTGSAFGVWATAGQAAYCAAKAGVVMLTKCMALEGAPSGVRANCVCPGMVATPMLEGIFAEQPDPAASRSAAVGYHPLGRLGGSEDIANAFVYLASEEASWVTGAVLHVDGGMTVGLDVHL